MVVTNSGTNIKNVIKINGYKNINHIRGPQNKVIWDRAILEPKWLNVYISDEDQTGEGASAGYVESKVEYSKSSGYAEDPVTATVTITIHLQVKQLYTGNWFANTVYVENGQLTPPDLVEDIRGKYGPLSVPDYSNPNGEPITDKQIVLQKSFEGFIGGYYFDGELITDGIDIDIVNATTHAY